MYPMVLVRDRKAIAWYLTMKFHGSLTPPWITVKVRRVRELPAEEE